jgi:hypothetical protein
MYLATDMVHFSETDAHTQLACITCKTMWNDKMYLQDQVDERRLILTRVFFFENHHYDVMNKMDSLTEEAKGRSFLHKRTISHF